MRSDSGNVMETHLGLFHALDHAQAVRAWVDLLSNHAFALRAEETVDADILRFLRENTKPELTVKKERLNPYFIGLILDKGMELHRSSKSERWHEDQVQRVRLPANYKGSKKRIWSSLLSDGGRYVVDSILDDLLSYGLADCRNYFIRLYSEWAHHSSEPNFES